MNFLGHNQKGDTIVEVIISIAILSAALAAAFSLGSNTLRNSEEANHRTEALALANSQVELLKNAVHTGRNLAPYKSSSSYCLKFDGSKTTACDAFNGSIYNLSDTYSSSTQAVTVNVGWSSATAPNGQASLDIYYRL